MIAYVEVPKVYSEVVGRDVGFTIGINGDGVDVVCMSVGIDFSGYSSHDLVLGNHAG